MKRFFIIIIGIFLIPLFVQPVQAESSRQGHYNHSDRRRFPEDIPKYFFKHFLFPDCVYYERIRIPPIYRWTHVPGRYTQQGRWIPGKWHKWITRPGHWERRPVWRFCR